MAAAAIVNSRATHQPCRSTHCQSVKGGANGVWPVYPYLRTGVVYGSATLPLRDKCAGGQPKALLKQLLLQDLPAEWVYRPKSGFTPPYRTMFADTPLQDYLRTVVLSERNPVRDFCDVTSIRRMIDRARDGSICSGAYDFLWALAFLSGWLQQVPSAAHAAGRVDATPQPA